MGKFKNIGVVVAARTNSTRLPGKVLLPLNGKPLIIFLLERLSTSKEINKLILATTNRKSDDKLASIVRSKKYEVFRGNEKNLVKRYVDVAEKYALDYIVRVTGDCPLVDSKTLDYSINQIKNKIPLDLATTKGFFPVGIDYEIYSKESMEKIFSENSLTSEDKEHLTLYFYKNKKSFNIVNIHPKPNWEKDYIFTVDTKEDYLRIKTLLNKGFISID